MVSVIREAGRRTSRWQGGPAVPLATAESGPLSYRRYHLGVVKAMEVVLERGFHANIPRVIVRTDSSYVADNYKSAMWVWSRNKWLTREGRPVDNADLWRKLIKLVAKLRRRFEIIWTPTKSDDEMRVADRLAKESSHNATEPTLAHVVLRRPRSTGRAQRGTLGLAGERVTLYVERAKYMRLQRITKYWFEVISEGEHHGKKGIVYSIHHMAGGHEYDVLFAGDDKFLRIVDAPAEVEKELVPSAA